MNTRNLTLGILLSLGLVNSALAFDMNKYSLKVAKEAKEKKEKKKAAKKAKEAKEKKVASQKKAKAKLLAKEKAKNSDELEKSQNELNEIIASADFSPSQMKECLAGLKLDGKVEKHQDKLARIQLQKDQIKICKQDKADKLAAALSEKEKADLAQKEEKELQLKLLALNGDLVQAIGDLESKEQKQCYKDGISLAPRVQSGLQGQVGLTQFKLDKAIECSKIKVVETAVPAGPRNIGLIEGEAVVGGIRPSSPFIGKPLVPVAIKPQLQLEAVEVAPAVNIGKPLVRPLGLGEVRPTTEVIAVKPLIAQPIKADLIKYDAVREPAAIQPIQDLKINSKDAPLDINKSDRYNIAE
jgi:hypothetical protein